MGVSPHVNWLYSDLADGLVIFQLFDIIKPGSVNWNRVHRKFSPLRKFMEKLENCNYAVELGKQLKFSLVGIAGHDLSDGNATLTLGLLPFDLMFISNVLIVFVLVALIWQIMRAYTLSVLTSLANSNSPIIEKEIVAWVNKKLEAAGKTSSIRNFQDSKIGDGKVVIDLVDSIKPGSVNYDNIKEGGTEEVKASTISTTNDQNSHSNANSLVSTFRITWQMQNMQFQWHEKSVLECMHYRRI